MTVKIDRAQELKYLRAFTPREVERVLKQAAKYGGMMGARVLKAAAPVGTSRRLGQYYREQGLKHGTLKRSVSSPRVRRRPGIAHVMGPVGRKAFTRHWVEARTHWLAKVTSHAFGVAQRASDAVLTAYARHPR